MLTFLPPILSCAKLAVDMGFFLSFVFGFLPMLLYAGLVYWLDRFEKEPKALLGGVFTWGAIVAAGGAFFINTVLGVGIYLFSRSETVTELTTHVFIAPFVEETLKGVAVLVVFLIFMPEFDSILDGIIYSAVTALGFAATENVYYIYRLGFVEAQYEGLLAMAFIRTILVGWQHPFYTAFTGIGLAITRMNRNTRIKIAAPLAGWCLAISLHSLHNILASLLSGIPGLIIGAMADWTGWIFMLAVAVLALRNEQMNIAVQLKEEVTLGTISAAQYQIACSTLAQSRAGISAMLSGSYQDTRRFYQTAAELAHKKRQLNQMGEENGNSQIIKQLRQDLADLSPVAYP
jgi:RsiW-degrading membrane proteinase PrsW (M82 family)